MDSIVNLYLERGSRIFFWWMASYFHNLNTNEAVIPLAIYFYIQSYPPDAHRVQTKTIYSPLNDDDILKTNLLEDQSRTFHFHYLHYMLSFKIALPSCLPSF